MEPASRRRGSGCTTAASAPRRLLASVSAVLFLSVASASAAQPGGGARPPDAPPAAKPAPPVITPPALKTDRGATYPAQAIKDKVKDPVEVVLVVEVDATGVVTNAVVEAPQGHGFDEAAVEAAKTLEFEPATRNGQAIAVKIRHKYSFAPPPAQLVGKVTTQLRDAPIAGATVTVVAADGRKWDATTKEDGAWRIDGVPAGTYKITVAASGFSGEEYEETLDPGTEAQVDMRLARPAAPEPPPPPGVTPSEVEEVTVHGTRPPREVTKRTLEQRELSRIPGTNGDALRAIQNLPGVARAPGLAGLLIVRGAAPQETGTYVDGTYVPIIYHFGGLSSVIPTEMLDKIDFYPGNFSTYFGRHTGGVIDVGVKDPQVKKEPDAYLEAARAGYHGLVQADLIDARMVAQGPVADTGWTFAIAGRRSYVDVWLKPTLTALGSGVTTAPVYYDYQLMLQRNWESSKRKHSLRLFFFGSDDRLDILVKQVSGSNPGLTGSVGLGTAFYRMQARYVGELSDDTELRLVGAVGKDAVQLNLGDNYFLLSSYPISGRAELAQRVGSGARNNLGIDLLLSPYDVDARLPPIPVPGEPPAGPFGGRPPLTLKQSGSLYRPALYDEVELTPFKGTRIVPGVRLDYTKENRSWDVLPRLVARQDLTSGFPRTTLKGGVGRFANPPQPQDTTAVFGVPGTTSTIANHYGFGGEQEITRQIEVSSEAFYRQYDNLIVSGRGNTGEGHAYGLETLVRYKPDEKFFGFLAYTLSRSVRRDGPGEPEHLFQYDQTHILTAIGSYRLGRGWELGARFRLVSGNLRTPQSYGFFDNNVGAYLPGQSYPPFSERNPMFHQLDLRIDKTWYFQEGVKMGAYLDLQNAYNQGNVEGVSYNYNSTLSTFATGLPILPSLGLRMEM